MNVPIAEAEQTEMNMTPMIDIVFQLIVFFLLSLKFKTIDQRIESMLPKDRGRDMKPVFPPEEDKIKLKVFRRDLAVPARAYTLVKVDNAEQFRLPAGWRGRARESTERVAAYDRTVRAVKDQIQRRLATYGGNPDAVKGEISAPPPDGGTVPHGDVVALLDAFIEAGMTNVSFEGQMTPLSNAERAARAARR